jgi:hypothetical protein
MTSLCFYVFVSSDWLLFQCAPEWVKILTAVWVPVAWNLLKLCLNGRKQSLYLFILFYLFICVCIRITEGHILDVEQQKGRTYNCGQLDKEVTSQVTRRNKHKLDLLMIYPNLKCGKCTFENSRRRIREDEVVGRWLEWRRFNSDGFYRNVRRVRRALGRKAHSQPSRAFSSSAWNEAVATCTSVQLHY